MAKQYAGYEPQGLQHARTEYRVRRGAISTDVVEATVCITVCVVSSAVRAVRSWSEATVRSSVTLYIYNTF